MHNIYIVYLIFNLDVNMYRPLFLILNSHFVGIILRCQVKSSLYGCRDRKLNYAYVHITHKCVDLPFSTIVNRCNILLELKAY